jgi:predicted TPR repeat methyltransferase
MTVDDERRDFYSRIARRYDDCVVKDIGYTAYKTLPERALELHPAAKTVLDLGCGTGLSAGPFFDAGLEVVGVDYAPGMIAVARSRPYKELFCQSIEDDLPVPDAFFDIATAVGVSEFIEDPATLLRTLWSKLRTNGLFCLTLPQPSENADSLNIKSYTVEDFMHFVDATQFRLVDSFAMYGWKSGYLAALDGEPTDVHLQVDYCAVFLRKRS